MVIEESDFRLTSCTETGHFWDLELLCTVRPKGKEARQEFKISGYGLTIEGAIDRITNFRISNKHPEAMTMKTYLDEYREIKEEIKKLCSTQVS